MQLCLLQFVEGAQVGEEDRTVPASFVRSIRRDGGRLQRGHAVLALKCRLLEEVPGTKIRRPDIGVQHKLCLLRPTRQQRSCPRRNDPVVATQGKTLEELIVPFCFCDTREELLQGQLPSEQFAPRDVRCRLLMFVNNTGTYYQQSSFNSHVVFDAALWWVVVKSTDAGREAVK